MRLYLMLNWALPVAMVPFVDHCHERQVGVHCYREIKSRPVVSPGGKIRANYNMYVDVVDGYAPLGWHVKLPCPDGTFAFRLGFKFTSFTI